MSALTVLEWIGYSAMMVVAIFIYLTWKDIQG